MAPKTWYFGSPEIVKLPLRNLNSFTKQPSKYEMKGGFYMEDMGIH